MPSKAKQLASLTAAGVSAIALSGSAAIVLTGGAAEAGIIYSPILNQSIGFTATHGTSHNHVVTTHALNSLAGGPDILLKASSNRYGPGPSFTFGRGIKLGGGGAKSTKFAKSVMHEQFATHFSAGAVWNGNDQAVAQFSVANRDFGKESTVNGHPSFTDQYFLFQFNGTSGLEYGWIEASLNVTSSHSASPSDGPTLTVIQYAFDNTGAALPAGDTGQTPEPSSIAESSLAALILGAEGLRRWRNPRWSS